MLPFCVTPPDPARQLDPQEVRRLPDLPERVFYMPNQVWRRKNHLLVIEAVLLLEQRRASVVVACTGKGCCLAQS